MKAHQRLGADATKQRLEEFRLALLQPCQTARAELFAARGREAHLRLLRGWFESTGVSFLSLRPPEPWDPLAPLKQLLEHHGLHYPEPAAEELRFTSLWLGVDTSWSRMLLRSALALNHRPTLVRIRRTDLDTPVWGAMLNYVRQAKLHMPVSFYFEAAPEARVLPGVVRLELEELDEPTLAEAAGAARPETETLPGKRALAYLAQARFFGNELRPQELKSVSRANPARSLEQLRKTGLLDEQSRLKPERLEGVKLPELPKSKRWNERALRILHKRGEQTSSRALWLRARLGPQGPQSPLTVEQACRAAIELGDSAARKSLQAIPQAALEPEAAAVSSLLGIDLGEVFRAEGPALRLGLVRLGMPHGPLLLGRLAMRLGQNDAGRQLGSCRDKLAEAGQPEAAALLSLELARWHLSFFRIRPGLKAIGSVPQTEQWTLLWLKNLAMAEAYIRMQRHDFARSHLQKAVSLPPRPISPVLKSDLYVTMGHMFSRAGFDVQAKSTLDRARDIYVGVRDGVRLGRYLITRGEMYWRAGDNRMAKQTFSRAVRILSELKAGLVNREAELKLTLILHGVSASTIEMESESRPQDLELRQRYPEGVPPKSQEAKDAE